MPHFMRLTTISKAIREGMALAIGANGFRMSRATGICSNFITPVRLNCNVSIDSTSLITTQETSRLSGVTRKENFVVRRLFNRLTLFPLFGLLVIATTQESFAYATNLFQQSTQEPRRAGSGASAENDVRALEHGKPHRREMAGGQRHAYRIRLAADQYLMAIIEQDGIDVMARLSGPDGKQIMEFDSESRLRGQEMVSQVAEVGGGYNLIVEPKLKEAPAGCYEIRIEKLRAATENDRALQEARNLYWKATDLRSAGKYDEAFPSYERALSIRENALGPNHPSVAISLNNLALLYHSTGEYATAETLQRRALSIKDRALGPEHSSVAESLNNLGHLYREMGENAKAEPLQRRALSIWEKALGPEHPNVAESLNNLASLHRNIGNYSKSEPLYQRALAIFEKAWGPEHTEVAACLNDLAVLYLAKGDIAQAIERKSRADAISERNLTRNLTTGSERQKLAYLATLSRQTDQTISLHLRHAPHDRVARNLAITLILQRKGRALDATSESLNALRRHSDAEDRALLDQLTDARSQIAKLVLDGPQRMTAEQYRDQIKTLEDRAEGLEADVSRRSREFRAPSLPVTLEAVQAAIPDDAALIEFASYRPFNPKAAKEGEAYGSPRYVAYTLRRQGEIQWKELGEAKAIDEAITTLRKALRDPKRKGVKRLARAVDEKVFRPIRPMVGELTRLLISPEGSLNLIPFAALVDESGRYLVKRYSISYLSSGRDLLRLQAPRESQTGPLVVADPDFGGHPRVESTRLPKQKKGKPKEHDKEEIPAPAFRQFYFPALPYTAEEGEALRTLLPGANLLTKRQASKTALKQFHGPVLLHIATHGFFLEDLKSTSTGKRGSQEPGGDSSHPLKQIAKDGARIENPLLRAGLALAGVNEQKEGDNGILTALEMTGLNLWGTKLVTLSACDTGVGEVRNGDGVHGLRRALALAGAETQVMSLWAVSDRWTKGLMVDYYRGLQRGQGRGSALRQAQLEMLKDVRRRHPYYWAGFILSGEWANLDGRREK
jgi:CHAT domain-containing protein/Tfp pilus assembly protein PilF